MKFPLYKLAVKEVAEAFGDASWIDRGAYGSVYAIDWRGQPAALKVLNTHTAAKEINNTRIIRALKSKAPPAVAAYLPEIYRAGMVEHGSETYGVIVMERLEKLPGKSKAQLFTKLYNLDSGEQEKFLRDPGFISHMFHQAVDDECAQLSEGDKKEVTAAGAAVFAQEVRSLNDPNNSRLIKKMAADIAARVRPGLELDIEQLRRVIYSVFADMSRARQIPISAGSPFLPAAEGEELRAALNWLVKNGIAWDDLHHGNLLVRPDGQLVLIDFGAYVSESEPGPDLPKYAFALFLR